MSERKKFNKYARKLIEELKKFQKEKNTLCGLIFEDEWGYEVKVEKISKEDK